MSTRKRGYRYEKRRGIESGYAPESLHAGRKEREDAGGESLTQLTEGERKTEGAIYRRCRQRRCRALC